MDRSAARRCAPPTDSDTFPLRSAIRLPSEDAMKTRTVLATLALAAVAVTACGTATATDSPRESTGAAQAAIGEEEIALLRERVALAERSLDRARTLEDAAQISAAERQRSERDLLLARLRLVEGRAELQRDDEAILAERLAAAEDLVRLEESAVELARRQVEGGRSSDLELLESEGRLLDARLVAVGYRRELQDRRDRNDGN
jgi:hypothetical protein